VGKRGGGTKRVVFKRKEDGRGGHTVLGEGNVVMRKDHTSFIIVEKEKKGTLFWGGRDKKRVRHEKKLWGEGEQEARHLGPRVRKEKRRQHCALRSRGKRGKGEAMHFIAIFEMRERFKPTGKENPRTANNAEKKEKLCKRIGRERQPRTPLRVFDGTSRSPCVLPEKKGLIPELAFSE